jgi:hypothetical protein
VRCLGAGSNARTITLSEFGLPNRTPFVDVVTVLQYMTGCYNEISFGGAIRLRVDVHELRR